jgi:hypothetical protein
MMKRPMKYASLVILAALAACQPLSGSRNRPAPGYGLRSSRPPVARTPAPAPPQEAAPRDTAWAQGEAARLIREAAPLFSQVADAFEKSMPADRDGLKGLLQKARTAEEYLSSAQGLYKIVEPVATDQQIVSKRIRILGELISTMRGAIKRIEDRL